MMAARPRRIVGHYGCGMGLASIVFLVAVALAITGCALAWIGWCGKKIDDHPLCRKCGFDLVGKPATSKVCSECGANLERPRAVKIGRRQRQGFALWSGATLLILVMGFSTVAIAGVLKGVNWRKYEPVSWLAYESKSSSQLGRTAAVNELFLRFSLGKLGKVDFPLVVDAGLTVQGRSDWAWDPKWGNLIEKGRATGWVSDAQWYRYGSQALRQAFGGFEFPEKVTRTLPIYCHLKLNNAKVSDDGPLWISRSIEIESIDGKEVYGPGTAMESTSFWSGRERDVSVSLRGYVYPFTSELQNPLLALSDGAHHAVVRIRIWITEREQHEVPSMADAVSDVASDNAYCNYKLQQAGVLASIDRPLKFSFTIASGP